MAPTPRKTSEKRTSRGDLTVAELARGLVEQAAWIDAKGTKHTLALSFFAPNFRVDHVTKDLWSTLATEVHVSSRVGEARTTFNKIRKQFP